MASKISTIYTCSACGAQSPKWSGRCLECGSWGALQMQTIDQQPPNKTSAGALPAPTIDFSRLEKINLARLETKIDEIDRVLGGGLVKGSLVLFAGEPGIGKSTLVAQIAQAINANNKNSLVFYASGEESAGQLKNRLDRLKSKIKNLKFIGETNCDKIIAAAVEAKPCLLIVDSIQTVYTNDVPTEAGSVNQIRSTAVKLLEMAKHNEIAVMLVGHITKDGSIAGPKSLEHIVDTVIYLECETAHNYCLLRSSKNRFGSTSEIGILEMTGTGFEEVKNPSSIFIEETDEKLTGSALSAIMEGVRPFLVEIQALVSKTIFGYPQRKASGYDLNRLQILSAVLTKKAKINLTNQDIILNIVGGMRLNEPSLDLAICAAIVSSLSNQYLDRQTLFIGEVGLGGEIRQIPKLDARLKEAEKLGFAKAVIPATNIETKKIKTYPIKNIQELLKYLQIN